MDQVSTYIIEENPLMRAGMGSLLEKSHFNVQKDVTSTDDLLKLSLDQECLLILSVGKSFDICLKTITGLKSASPKIKVVILCDRLTVPIITSCFSIGADGLLLKDITAEALIASIELVMAGEKVFPTSLASIISSRENYWDLFQQVDFDNNTGFSPRTIEIIRCVANGYSNKLIGRQLGITESTVKVHLKSILRKLNLNNRTQIALWAINHGICPYITADNANTTMNMSQ